MQKSEAGIPLDGFIRIKTEFTPSDWSEEKNADGISGSGANSKKRKVEDDLTDEETKLLEEKMTKKMNDILEGRMDIIKQQMNDLRNKILRDIKSKREQSQSKKTKIDENVGMKIGIKQEIEEVDLDSQSVEPSMDQNQSEMAPNEELTWEDMQACESKKELILISGKIDEILDAREKVFEEKWKKFAELKKELEKEAREIKTNRQQKEDMLVAKLKEFEDKESENKVQNNSNVSLADKNIEKRKNIYAKKSDTAANEKQDGASAIEQKNQKLRDRKGQKDSSGSKSSKSEDQDKVQQNGEAIPQSPKPLKLVRRRITGPSPELGSQKDQKKVDASNSAEKKSPAENKEKKNLSRSPSPERYDDDDDVDNLSLRTVESVHSGEDDNWAENGQLDGEIARIAGKLAQLEHENARLEGRGDEYDPLNPTSDGEGSFDIGCLENMSLPRSRSNESGEIRSSGENDRLSRSRSREKNRRRSRRNTADLSRSLSKESDKREWRKTTRSSKSPSGSRGSRERSRAQYSSRNENRSSRSSNDEYRRKSNDDDSRDRRDLPSTSRGDARWDRKDDFPSSGSPSKKRYSRERDNHWAPKSSQGRFEKDNLDNGPTWRPIKEYYNEENRRENANSFKSGDKIPSWKKPKTKAPAPLRPIAMTLQEWQEEKICRNVRKRNILIKGLEFRFQTREKIADFLGTHLKVNVSIENIIKDPKGVVITCSTASEKFRILQRRNNVRGKVWIGEDYTKMQENLQEWLKHLADRLRNKGDNIKLGQQKIRINGQEFVWSPLKGSLVPERKA